jgi:flagellar biosynthesis/type III secretory pathway M-ring protein FliF/YscJ
MKLEALRQHVPLTSQFDHLLRYETALERNFERTLSQLERVQRLRLSQPVLPKLEVHHSVS